MLCRRSIGVARRRSSRHSAGCSQHRVKRVNSATSQGVTDLRHLTRSCSVVGTWHVACDIMSCDRRIAYVVRSTPSVLGGGGRATGGTVRTKHDHAGTDTTPRIGMRNRHWGLEETIEHVAHKVGVRAACRCGCLSLGVAGCRRVRLAADLPVKAPPPVVAVQSLDVHGFVRRDVRERPASRRGGLLVHRIGR